MKTHLVAIFWVFAAWPTLIQSAQQSQLRLKDEKLEAHPTPSTEAVQKITADSCSLKPGLIIEGIATGQVPGSFKGTIKNLVVNKKSPKGNFEATFTVTGSDGDVVTIHSQAYKQSKPLDCEDQGGPSGSRQRHMGFEFITRYDATSKNGHRHICGEAFVSGLMGWSQATHIFKPHFSETINTEEACHNSNR